MGVICGLFGEYISSYEVISANRIERDAEVVSGVTGKFWQRMQARKYLKQTKAYNLDVHSIRAGSGRSTG